MIKSSPPPPPKSKNARGRPRIRAMEVPMFDSLQHMAGMTGIPLSVLKLAKRSGCMFCSHGRCDLIIFLKWFFVENQEKQGHESIDWISRDKRGSALLKEAKLEEELERVIDFSIASRFVNYITQVAFFSELERLAQEFPATLKGKNEIEVENEVELQIKQIKESLKKSVQEWIEKKGKV